MFDRFAGQNKKIALGVQFGAGALGFTESVASLASRCGTSLRVVHAVEPWKETGLGAIYPGKYLAHKIARLDQKRQVEEAKAKLDELKSHLRLDQAIEAEAIGEPSSVFITETLSHHASILCCSAGNKSAKSLPSGYSRATTYLI